MQLKKLTKKYEVANSVRSKSLDTNIAHEVKQTQEASPSKAGMNAFPETHTEEVSKKTDMYASAKVFGDSCKDASPAVIEDFFCRSCWNDSQAANGGFFWDPIEDADISREVNSQTNDTFASAVARIHAQDPLSNVTNIEGEIAAQILMMMRSADGDISRISYRHTTTDDSLVAIYGSETKTNGEKQHMVCNKSMIELWT